MYIKSKLLNSKEASMYLKVSIHTIYKMSSNRTIDFIRQGNRIFFFQDVLDEYLSRNIIEAI